MKKEDKYLDIKVLKMGISKIKLLMPIVE